MPTKISDIIAEVRSQLNEPVANYWTDAELKNLMRHGAINLWGSILDLHQDHYLKIAGGGGANATDPVYKANTTQVANVPPDCFRIQLIEPRDTTVNGTGFQCIFIPRKYKDTDFTVARTMSPVDPSSLPARQIYYQVTGVGSPVDPPNILMAPMLSADLPLKIAYNPTIWGENEGQVFNPVPGGSDLALKAWTIAYARAKESTPPSPDPGWLAIYATEKQSLLTRLTPREEQEPEVVEDMFQGYGSVWG